MVEEQKVRKRRTFKPRAIPGKYKNAKNELHKTDELVYKARFIVIFIEEKHFVFDRNWKVSRQSWTSETKN